MNLTPTGNPNVLLTSGEFSKDVSSRLRQYQAYLTTHGLTWVTPDLQGYRDWLAQRGLAPTSIRAHLATVRGRYVVLLRREDTHVALYTLAYEQLARDGHAPTPANAAAYVQEAIRRIEAALHPGAAPVKVITRQDVTDVEHLRLMAAQANALLQAPGITTLRGLRDTALLALLLCTGVREQELCQVEKRDLRQRLGGALALHVRVGKGAKERLVPYGSLEWCLALVEAWLQAAAIEAGVIFRGIYKGGQHVRATGLTTRNVQRIVASYPVMVDGILTAVKPHDLRRTYARRLYEAGVDLVAIQQNLGHADSQTTLGYIGRLGAEQRQPPAVYTFDLSLLRQLPT